MTVLVTGAAGFIGYHTASRLLARGEAVCGIDSLNDYYDPTLKHARLAQLRAHPAFSFVEGNIASGALDSLPTPERIVHLAAQAGVRYSIENPMAYVEANLRGHTAVLEFARHRGVGRVVYASSSSVYGGNKRVPFSETDPTDDPVSFYGATKKSNEILSQAYARLYGIELVGLRFFTVYGPFGRPDMAYWMFARSILTGETLRLFNGGQMGRDFTYIDDCVSGVVAALDQPLTRTDGVSHRLYNLGNDRPEPLAALVSTLEQQLGRTAICEVAPMQAGDVERTWANIDRARAELGYAPQTPLDAGLGHFVRWFRTYSDGRL